MFDKLTVVVMYNVRKTTLFSVEERVKMLKEAVKDIKNVSVDSYSGLVSDYAKENNFHVSIRGLRAVTDFEYELQMADINRQLTGIETVVLFTEPRLAPVSSSVVRELAHFGKDITPFLPAGLHYPSTNKQPQS
jgi:pantetheine-phosphate adenylyltransferase